MNQNWSGSSFPTPLNTRNFIALSILKCGGNEGGVGGDEVEYGETGGGVSGVGMHEIRDRMVQALASLLCEHCSQHDTRCINMDMKLHIPYWEDYDWGEGQFPF